MRNKLGFLLMRWGFIRLGIMFLTSSSWLMLPTFTLMLAIVATVPLQVGTRRMTDRTHPILDG